MSLGNGNILVNEKTRQSGPPFVLTSALNGLSVNAAGQIVLGQDAVGGSGPADLLNNREIPLNGFTLLIEDFAAGIGLQIDGTIFLVGNLAVPSQGIIQLDPNAGDLNITSVGTTALLLSGQTDTYTLGDSGLQFTGQNISFLGPIQQVQILQLGQFVLQFDQLNNSYQIGDVQATLSDGSALIINDTPGTSTVTLFAGRNSNSAALQLDDGGSVLNLTNNTTNMVIRINGQSGFTGTVTPVTSITVEGGIVTAVS